MNLPSDFVQRTKELLKGEYDDFCQALLGESPTAIRLNRSKSQEMKPNTSQNVAWYDTGYYLAERPQFTFDPLLHAGCYYVQEASSMFVGQVLEQYVKGDVKVLDLCAAPGGKSTLISDFITENSLLVSNEVIRSRSHILAENLAKWGNANTIVANNDPERIGQLTDFFDVIVVDAPCSGEGMFRKDKGAIDEWSVANVELCKQRQQRIVADIWNALKPNGILIYSTCTYNKEENEDNVQWICDELGGETLPIETNEGWGITSSFVDGVHAYRFLPHKTKGEGFFLAAIRKNDGEVDTVELRKKNKNKKGSVETLSDSYKSYLLNKEDFFYFKKGDKWHALPNVFEQDFSILEEKLHIISAGICMGEMKGKDFIPDQSLALSNSLNKKAFEVCEIDWNTAIGYLRKETLVFPDLPRGYILLTFKDKPIGFVKNIGNRANNLYPQEWRIRSSNVPSEEVNVLID